MGAQLYRLSWGKEKFLGEISQAELSLTYLRADDLLSRTKLWSRKKGRLVDHRKNWANDEVPIRIEVEWIDRLDVEDVLCVVGVADIKVGIVLKGDADQIADGILRRLAQAFSLLGMSCRCRHHRKRPDG
jgi:hypothetical protein